ncbi:MAG: LURP-one-related family protein [Oscillospiraceae bacterium]|nr:LURP-one-related family protein [Oscillospiraceae bacterium]
MGIFSDIHRFREQGKEANKYNVSEYGRPARSLFTSSKLFSLHHRIDITDENGNVVYEANSKLFSLHDKTDIKDANGRQVAHIEKKFLSLHERHFVTMADGTRFELSNELFHLIGDITNIEGLGWQLRGNILGLNFSLCDENEDIIAVMNQKMLSVHDKYCVDIYRPEYEDKVVAILITLQHMIIDRENSAASSSSSSSSD